MSVSPVRPTTTSAITKGAFADESRAERDVRRLKNLTVHTACSLTTGGAMAAAAHFLTATTGSLGVDVHTAGVALVTGAVGAFTVGMTLVDKAWNGRSADVTNGFGRIAHRVALPAMGAGVLATAATGQGFIGVLAMATAWFFLGMSQDENGKSTLTGE